MSVYIYFHICCINNWANIVSRLYDQIRGSGLYDVVTEIRCTVIGEGAIVHPLFSDPKVRVIIQTSDFQNWEVVTINAIHEYAVDHPEENYRVLYIHSKGVRHNGQNPNVTDWTNYMAHFMVDRHELCRTIVDDYDAVGVNLNEVPDLHYSGNFWWSNAKHIRTLSRCKYNNYNAPEYWVTSSPGKYICLWKSGMNHYDVRYPPETYVDMPIQAKLVTFTYR